MAVDNLQHRSAVTLVTKKVVQSQQGAIKVRGE